MIPVYIAKSMGMDTGMDMDTGMGMDTGMDMDTGTTQMMQVQTRKTPS